MAQVDATAFKAAVALAAAQLTIMWQDTILTEVADELQNPLHPLRDIQSSLFLIDKGTCVVTSNDDLIDAIYTGRNNPEPNKLNTFLEIAPPLLVSADIEIAEPSDIVLVFDKAVTNFLDVILGGVVTTAKTIVSISGLGTTTITIVVSTPYIAGDTATISGLVNKKTATNQLTDEVVTNNIV